MRPTSEMNLAGKAAAATLALAALGACGGNKGSAAENSADTLRSAAEQSTPEARNLLMNEAERLEQQNLPPGGEGAAIQNALQNAGNAQAQGAPPPLQAQPRQPGDAAPPPKAPPPQ